MTIHSKVEYKCEYCDNTFVPIPQSPNCPKCNRESKVVFPDFVKDTVASARYNISRYGSFIPRAWLNIKVGDSYYHFAFQFLNYVCSELKVSEEQLLSRKYYKAQINLLTSKFLSPLKFDSSEPYLRHRLEIYLSLLLQENPNNTSSGYGG